MKSDTIFDAVDHARRLGQQLHICDRHGNSFPSHIAIMRDALLHAYEAGVESTAQEAENDLAELEMHNAYGDHGDD